MDLAKLLHNNNFKIQTEQISYTKMKVSVSSGYNGLCYRFTDLTGNLLSFIYCS